MLAASLIFQIFFGQSIPPTLKSGVAGICHTNKVPKTILKFPLGLKGLQPLVYLQYESGLPSKAPFGDEPCVQKLMVSRVAGICHTNGVPKTILKFPLGLKGFQPLVYLQY